MLESLMKATRGFDGLDETLVLCASSRLARHLRQAHGRAQAARGLARWKALDTATVAQWLDKVVGAAVLAGEIPVDAARGIPLNAAQERVLWERAIETAASGDAEDALFDREGLAQAAAEANELVEAWGIRPEADAHGEETQALLRWRDAFRNACDAADWREPVRHREWQIACIARGAGRLPGRIAFAGFDRLQPQETRLARALEARGVAVVELVLGRDAAGAAVALALPDSLAECRAAAAWAARRLAGQPAARLGIVVPELAALRAALALALDEALHPAALNPAQAEMPRCYDFSLGTPLARQPLVGTALALLGLAANPARIEQAQLGDLLRRPYWSTESEADERDRLDAAMREMLAPQLTLERVLRFVRRRAAKGMALPRTLACLDALKGRMAARQLPSQWAAVFPALTFAAGWPGDRPLSSCEWQAQRAFAETLDSLGQFDALLGRVTIAEALRRLQQLCRERIFQPEAAGADNVFVMGLLEAAAEPLDGLWVMGMNDQHWPPAARPNPLLPAGLQRRARAPNASAEVQSEFARAVHRRLLRSAPEIVFSWAHSEAGRELRMSPLLAGLPPAAAGVYAAATDCVERLAGGAGLVRLDDWQAPPVHEGEKVRGGTGLLKAQAICPAWAFYRYRLGARALAEPVAGLDAAARGTLLHGVLEHFWRGRGSAELAAMDEATRAAALAAAADAALADFNRDQDEPLTPRFQALERERLLRLAASWLAFEAGRPVPFRVVACEAPLDIEIEGIAVHLVVDRIDEVDEGGGAYRIVIDYKTAAKVSAASWARERIVEPQLPVYAAYAAQGHVGALAFAWVRPDDCRFVGIAAENGMLPKVAGIAEDAARKVFPAVADWEDLFAHWRKSIAAVAREVREGVAAVRVTSEADLAYCEVKPLLRLAEARSQSEENAA